MAIKAITTDSFRDDVLKTRKPVLIKFWAPWCGYCRALAPALESIEKQYENPVSYTHLLEIDGIDCFKNRLYRDRLGLCHGDRRIEGDLRIPAGKPLPRRGRRTPGSFSDSLCLIIFPISTPCLENVGVGMCFRLDDRYADAALGKHRCRQAKHHHKRKQQCYQSFLHLRTFLSIASFSLRFARRGFVVHLPRLPVLDGSSCPGSRFTAHTPRLPIAFLYIAILRLCTIHYQDTIRIIF